MRAARRWLISLSIVAAACGGDDSAVDGGPTADAGICGDDVFYQVEVYSWSTNAAALPTTVSIVGQPGATTMSAPNGRAILCLSAGVSQVRFEEAGHIPVIQVVSTEAYQSYISNSGQLAHRVYLLTEADLDGIGTIPANLASAHVVVEARNGLGAAAGTIVAISAEGEPFFVGSAGGAFSQGATIGPSAPFAVARNVSTEGGTSATLTIEGGDCDAPAELPLSPGVVTATLVSCAN